jgi:cytochrome c oxidase cbb3-type subunit I
MSIAPTNVSPEPAERVAAAEITAVDLQLRGPLLFLLGSGLVWLVISGFFTLIASIQLHSPGFLANSELLTHGRAQALRETAFIYGWAANAGLAVALWLLARLGGAPLRATNWVLIGGVFWNLGVTVGLVGIATGDMTSFPFLQMPHYVQPLLLASYAAIGISGVLAWSGRRKERMFASHWYIVAALFLFPWFFATAQVMLLWAPVRGTLQAVAAGWFAQSVWTLWLAPLGLAAAYYITPKVTGRILPSYEFAPLGFWTLIVVGAWTGGRHLIGGPVPAWIPTLGTTAVVMVLFHHLIVLLNLRIAFRAGGNALRFIQFGFAAYILSGVLEAVVSFRGVAVATQFTLVQAAFVELAFYGGVSMMLFGAIYYMVPRLTGSPWSSAALTVGHRMMVMFGIALAVVTLAVAGIIQGSRLLDPAVPIPEIVQQLRVPLLIATGAQLVILSANILLLVNFCQSACVLRRADEPAAAGLRQPSGVEVVAS